MHLFLETNCNLISEKNRKFLCNILIWTKRKLHEAIFSFSIYKNLRLALVYFVFERVALYLGKRVRRGIVNNGSKDVTGHHVSGEKNGNV